MKWTNTINPATQSLNDKQPAQINPEANFSRQITTNTKPKRKKLIARWSLDENSKLFCQWVFD
ncbi:MAG: hypothetical protein KME30_08980 [Iphinoe sp. HA4291-MV1]|jgi:hypothetical protein|nr:hypothetical protein [Iphinoe sp. HA4291-MV1]